MMLIKKLKAYILMVMCSSLFLLSCNKFETQKEYYNYINNKSNGLIKILRKKEVEYKLLYMPTELRYLYRFGLQKEYKKNLEELNNSIEFVFTISPTDKCRVRDLNYFNVTNEEEYIERQNKINFYIQSYLKLNIKGVTFRPQLCHRIKSNIDNILSFSLVFTPDSEDQINLFNKKNDIIFQFDDPFFCTNKNEFKILGSAKLAVPHLNI